jgi:hypothetical protein
MSASPPKETDVEQGVQSPDDPDAQMNDPQDPHASGLAYEFEVKEQDRWLPIANGQSFPLAIPFSKFASTKVSYLCVLRLVVSGIASKALYYTHMFYDLTGG